jgi:hypothetical protein
VTRQISKSTVQRWRSDAADPQGQKRRIGRPIANDFEAEVVRCLLRAPPPLSRGSIPYGAISSVARLVQQDVKFAARRDVTSLRFSLGWIAGFVKRHANALREGVDLDGGGVRVDKVGAAAMGEGEGGVGDDEADVRRDAEQLPNLLRL